MEKKIPYFVLIYSLLSFCLASLLSCTKTDINNPYYLISRSIWIETERSIAGKTVLGSGNTYDFFPNMILERSCGLRNPDCFAARGNWELLGAGKLSIALPEGLRVYEILRLDPNHFDLQVINSEIVYHLRPYLFASWLEYPKQFSCLLSRYAFTGKPFPSNLQQAFTIT